MKKVLLFIVEGVSDDISLGFMSKLVDREVFKVHILHGDITSDNGNTSGNIISRMDEEITKFLDRNFYQLEDISRIVHLIDTDGLYVGEEFVKPGENEGFVYKDGFIFAKDIKKVLDRNLQKSSIVSKLCTIDSIRGIDYSMYYFSCNREHVFINECNIPDGDKKHRAEEFSDRYYGIEKVFISFIRNQEFAVAGSYRETWEFIKVGNNSLKRYSNFHLFFSDNDK